MAVKKYSLKNGTLAVNGVIIQGSDDDDFIEATRNNDSWELTAGADGQDQVFSGSNDKTGQITVHLKQTSDANAVFQAYSNQDEIDQSGSFDISYSNPDEGITFFANDARFSKPADYSGGKSAGARDWVILCPELEFEQVQV